MLESKKNYSVESLFSDKRNSLSITEDITSFFKNKSILVTGAGGSIGKAIVEQLIDCNPKEIVCIENSEYNLFKLESFIDNTDIKNINIITKYFDIRDCHSIEWLLKNNPVDVIFHSAALKHVKIVENNREEAVKTNVIATYNLMKLANKYNVKEFLFVSTDKVVESSSYMGKTKKMGEHFARYFSKKNQTNYLTVRFGNVIGSSGSVIPIFLERIENQEPLIIRDFKAKRYFMSIKEAIFLVLKATVEGKNGESYILKMGEQIYIKDIAEKLLEFTNAKNKELIETKLLKGEKLEESLMTEKEVKIASELEDFFVFTNDTIPKNIEEIIDIIENNPQEINELTELINNMCE